MKKRKVTKRTPDTKNLLMLGGIGALIWWLVTRKPPVGTGSIAGTVTNASDGSAIEGARVSVWYWATEHIATTGIDGTYIITGVPVGEEYSVTASAIGFEPQTKIVTVIENETTIVDFAFVPVPPEAIVYETLESYVASTSG